ncbi:MAG: Na+/H+ antiporter subunit E [Bacteroidota bacterium]
MKKVKNIGVLTFLLAAAWILMNNSIKTGVILTGAGLALLSAIILCSRCDIFSEWKITPKSLIYSVGYLFVFLFELLKSNLDVARRVVTPSLPINPGIVAVKTSLQSKIGRMILANSITLTPGTLTVDIKEDTLYIHWIDVESTDIKSATKAIVSKFEKYLEVIYG